MTEPSDVFRVNCPTCSARSGDACRTLTTRQRTAPHSARYVLLGETQHAHPAGQRRHLRLVR